MLLFTFAGNMSVDFSDTKKDSENYFSDLYDTFSMENFFSRKKNVLI